jgi:hypothetical protein
MGGSEVAKKTARKAAAPRASNAPERGKKPTVIVPNLKAMLEQLRDELIDIERRDGPNRKTVTALTRINDLLPLLRCQESMTRP